jgi:putative endonuclease
MKRGGVVYIMTNKNNTTLYVGVTADLKRRVYEHKNNLYSSSFTCKYQLHKLVYYEVFDRIEDAIKREKQIKSDSRKKKLEIISKHNKEWKDLYDEITSW